MDTLTHALSGALLGRATAPRCPKSDQLTIRGRMALGFVAAAFPDSDFILRGIDVLTYLNLHRGVTHSIVMLPLWALILALVVRALNRNKKPWRVYFGVIAMGIGIHIAGDVITAYGTKIFAPFSDFRLSWPTTFIIDPFSPVLSSWVCCCRRFDQWADPWRWQD